MLACPNTLSQNCDMIWGYVRASAGDKTLDLRRRGLRHAGCGRSLEGRMPGALGRQSGGEDALARCGASDVRVERKLDRPGRLMPHVIKVMRGLAARGCSIQSLTENTDAPTADGGLVFRLMDALPECARALTAGRTTAGPASTDQREGPLDRKRVSSAELARLRVGRSLPDRPLDAGKGRAA